MIRNQQVRLDDVADRPLLGEGAGVVVAVGPGVEDLRAGDRVMGLLNTSGGTVAVADQRNLVRIPSGLSFVEAATIPVACLVNAVIVGTVEDLGRLVERTTGAGKFPKPAI